MEWLHSIPHGVVLVQLKGRDFRSNIVDNTVTVDFTKWMIHDYAEQYVIQLSHESFKCCMGGGFYLHRSLKCDY